MKPSKLFIDTIADYLNKAAAEDPLFAQRMSAHPEKTPAAVCNFILSEVSKTRKAAYTDQEIYSLAKHFIDEDTLTDPGSQNSVKGVAVPQSSTKPTPSTHQTSQKTPTRPKTPTHPTRPTTPKQNPLQLNLFDF